MKLSGDPSQRPVRGAKTTPRDTARKGHILVVEDNPGVLGATQEFLRIVGYEVTTATSLAEAVERAGASPDLDVLITDYHLGDHETGRQVVTAVRQIFGPEFKAIVMTGDTSTAVHSFDADRCLCWVRKPFSPRHLATVLENFLSVPSPESRQPGIPRP